MSSDDLFDFSQARIQLLRGSTTYLTERDTVRENQTSLLHVADIHSTNSGAIQVFVKTFPEPFFRNGLSNEIAGYLFASAAGLPVAREAYVMIMESEKLFHIHPHYRDRIYTEDGYTYLWITRAIGRGPIRYLHKVDEPEFQKRLAKWPSLPSVLAFDDVMLNEDRTADNLVAISNGAFFLVDHADIAGGIGRLSEFLDPQTSCKNRLLSDIFGTDTPIRVKSAMVMAAEKHKEIFHQIAPELQFWLEKLFPKHVSENEALLHFLSVRADASPDRIRQELQLLV